MKKYTNPCNGYVLDLETGELVDSCDAVIDLQNRVMNLTRAVKLAIANAPRNDTNVWQTVNDIIEQYGMGPRT